MYDYISGILFICPGWPADRFHSTDGVLCYSFVIRYQENGGESIYIWAVYELIFFPI